MIFCGGCGKRASEEDKFYTNCGTRIKETTAQVVEEVGDIIKNEYREQSGGSSLESLYFEMI